jgi:hypothetical protein
MIKILACECAHEYQDKKYGAGKRVHNSCKDDKDYRCTICQKVKMGSVAKK